MTKKTLGYVLYEPFLGFISKSRPYIFHGEKFANSIKKVEKDFLNKVKIYSTLEKTIKGRDALYKSVSNVDEIIIMKLYDDLSTKVIE